MGLSSISIGLSRIETLSIWTDLGGRIHARPGLVLDTRPFVLNCQDRNQLMKYTSGMHHARCMRFQQDCLHVASPRVRKAGMRLWVSLLAVTAMLLATVFNGPAAAADQEQELLALLTRMESSYAKVQDYSAVFRKHERVKEVLLQEESVFIKFRKPLQVYMKWIDGPVKEALYVDGENNSKVIAHSDGVGANLTWNLDPRGSILSAGNRHPITDIGFGFILTLMRTNIPVAVTHAEIEVIRMVDDHFEGRPAIVVEARLTPKDGRVYYANRMVCHIDKEYLLPVGIACYDEKNVLMEEYGYKDVKINIGLTEMDFSRKNPLYKF